MNDHLTHSMLFANLSNVAGREYIEALTKCFDELQERVTEEVRSMTRDFNAVIAAEGQISEAEKAPAVADALRSRFEGTEEILQRVNVILGGLNPDD
jgi:phage regulator Rha-like protein